MTLELSDDFRVVSCSSGKDALLAVERFIPDVFLLDVMMPGWTGPETLEKLWEMPNLKKVPAVFMTARVSPGSRAELLATESKMSLQSPSIR